MTSPQLRGELKARLARHPRLYNTAKRARRLVRASSRWRQRSPKPIAKAPAESRLVPSPVFVISSVRSGSTLLRVILNTHPDICAPHELHLRCLRVEFEKRYAEIAFKELGIDKDELEHLLWDRVLHHELSRSGKRIFVDKTPGNANVYERLATCWPNARFIFLLRHPASIVASLMETRPDRELEPTINEALTYLKGVEAAKQALPGLVVRYEDLTDDPARVTKEICRFLGIRWDARMLDYGQSKHGKFRPFIGDWSSKIRSGRIQEGRPLPDPEEVPEEVRPYARSWGYMT
ncbi:sulfotransferase [Actinopolymorpha sp. B17G11]|uniref:sulfotransferase family protein n=1 Tax=unclassified Actinopolymorpha TaxID=2627063 RepID=UPI0032D996D1